MSDEATLYGMSMASLFDLDDSETESEWLRHVFHQGGNIDGTDAGAGVAAGNVGHGDGTGGLPLSQDEYDGSPERRVYFAMDHNSDDESSSSGDDGIYWPADNALARWQAIARNGGAYMLQDALLPSPADDDDDGVGNGGVGVSDGWRNNNLYRWNFDFDDDTSLSDDDDDDDEERNEMEAWRRDFARRQAIVNNNNNNDGDDDDNDDNDSDSSGATFIGMRNRRVDRHENLVLETMQQINAVNQPNPHSMIALLDNYFNETPAPTTPTDATSVERLFQYKMKKLRQIGELLEIVETMRVQRDFIDLFHAHLVQYYRRRHRYLKAKPQIDARRESSKQLEARLSQAFDMLRYLHMKPDDGGTIVRLCLDYFEQMRELRLFSALENRAEFERLFCQYANAELTKDLCWMFHSEVKRFSVVSELIYHMQYDVMYKLLSKRNYEKKLKLLKLLTVSLFSYENYEIPSSSRFVMKRALVAIHFFMELISQLIYLADDLDELEPSIAARDLAERDRLWGRQVHLTIIKPADQLVHGAPERVERSQEDEERSLNELIRRERESRRLQNQARFDTANVEEIRRQQSELRRLQQQFQYDDDDDDDDAAQPDEIPRNGDNFLLGSDEISLDLPPIGFTSTPLLQNQSPRSTRQHFQTTMPRQDLDDESNESLASSTNLLLQQLNEQQQRLMFDIVQSHDTTLNNNRTVEESSSSSDIAIRSDDPYASLTDYLSTNYGRGQSRRSMIGNHDQNRDNNRDQNRNNNRDQNRNNNRDRREVHLVHSTSTSLSSSTSSSVSSSRSRRFHACTIRLTKEEQDDVREGFFRFYRRYSAPTTTTTILPQTQSIVFNSNSTESAIVLPTDDLPLLPPNATSNNLVVTQTSNSSESSSQQLGANNTQ